MHHPFTVAASTRTVDKLESDPGAVRAKAYDLVLNGSEIGGGSIRIHDAALQARIFSRLGISDEEAKLRFGFFLEALEYGTPPHGGIALGLDRIVAILAGEASIREVIAFPKTANAVDLMAGAPSPVDAKQLRELHMQDPELTQMKRITVPEEGIETLFGSYDENLKHLESLFNVRIRTQGHDLLVEGETPGARQGRSRRRPAVRR